MSWVNVAGAGGPHSGAMETKDSFMRFVVIGSIVAVGLLAFLVRLRG